MKILENSHDLQLPDWGPYSKKYAGISHVANSELGIRFDLSVFPAMYRRRVDLPNCMAEGNYHIWQANADLSYFCTRHELEWKDELYTDISYSKLEENSYVIRAKCVNNTNDTQNLALHYMASLHYPSINAKYDEKFLYPIEYNLPDKSRLIYAIDFDSFEHKTVRPTDSLVVDGLRRGEVRKEGFYRGSGVCVGEFDGDVLHYSLKDGGAKGKVFKNPAVTVRYINTSKENVQLSFFGAINAVLILSAGDAITTVSSEITLNSSDKFAVCASGGQAIIDSIIISEFDDLSGIKIKELAPAHLPKSWENLSEYAIDYEKDSKLNLQITSADKLPLEKNTLVLKYRDTDYYYGICWDVSDYDIRYFISDELDTYIKIMAHDHVNKVLYNNDGIAYSNVFMRPIPIEPKSFTDIYGAVCMGKTKAEVEEKLCNILKDRKVMRESDEKKGRTAVENHLSLNGQKYAFSQNIMMATTFSNVVYPIYTKRSYIKHNTPGTWWDSLYTWDSGFTGLGLASCDIDRAIDCLNAYITKPGDEENAFIHHGTPIPVQFYLFQELFNRTASKKLALYCYPRLRQYYLFLAGKLGSSDTARLKSNMLVTWSYFYNSGGWDDYPPQVDVHFNNNEKYISPVLNTAHAIRCAKILIQTAQLFSQFAGDIAEYTEDINRFSEAIQTHTWDEKSGYFGYLCHDENLNPTKILRHSSGENFNRGLDGMSPMISGILTREQTDIIVRNLMDETRHFTPIGISTVDKSAPYYKIDGYWNGAVWMPHQWFYYKSLLDYGHADYAFKIAQTALDTFEREVSESYNCYEHFIVASERGAGWHHFSGLSTPVLLWCDSYYKAGTVTFGYDGIMLEKNFDANSATLCCKIKFLSDKDKTSIIIVMPENKEYRVMIGEKSIDFIERLPGVIELCVQVKSSEELVINILSLQQ